MEIRKRTFHPNRESQKAQEKIKERWNSCTKCEIGKTCLNHVIGRGKIPCEVLFIGEAPGPQEDSSGYPFVGSSGKLLQKLIAETFKRFRPYSYFITNTILCFPEDENRPGCSRLPSHSETSNCLPRLIEQIEVAKPDLTIFVGKVAGILPTLIKSINPAWWDLTPHLDHTLTILHPSYLLRKGGTFSLEYKRTTDNMVEFLNKYGRPFDA